MTASQGPWTFREDVDEPSSYEAVGPIPVLQAVRMCAGDALPTCSKSERGVVITPRYEAIAPVAGSPKLPVDVDEEHFRTMLLFFDKIDVPTLEFGPLTHWDRSVTALQGTDIAMQSVIQFPEFFGPEVGADKVLNLRSFLVHDQRQPGQWVIGRTDDVSLPPEVLAPDRAFAIKLSNALPTFARTVALDDVLSFKSRHKDELQLLRIEMDNLIHELAKSQFNAFASAHLLKQFDGALRDYVSAVKASNFKKVMRSLKISVDLPAAVRFAMAVGTGVTAGLPLTQALLTGLASEAAVTLTSECGLGGLNNRTGPYEYLTVAEQELY